MSVPTASDRRLAAQIRAHVSWANTEDRSARTANARAAMWQKFLNEADGDPERAEHLRRAFYLRMAAKSAKARRERAARNGMRRRDAGEAT